MVLNHSLLRGRLFKHHVTECFLFINCKRHLINLLVISIENSRNWYFSKIADLVLTIKHRLTLKIAKINKHQTLIQKSVALIKTSV